MVGKPVAALDIPAKVNGSAGYGIDVFLPGMVYARWLSPPVRYGATPKSVDDSAAKSVDGYIKTIMVPGTSMQNGYALAIAETKHAVDAAAATIQVEWEHGQFANISSESLLQESRKLIDDKDAGVAWVLDGDVEAGLSASADVHEAEYTTSILAHACMEPMNCVATEQDGTYHIFVGTQWATRCVPLIAEAVGVDPANLSLIHI